MSALAILFLGLTFLLRITISINTIASLYLALSYISAVILVYYSGLIYSSILPWLALIPLSANLLLNQKASFIWLALCFIAVFAFAYFTKDSSNVIVHYDKQFEPWFYAGVYNGLTGIILVLSMVFQQAKENVLKKLENRNELISSINRELKSKNNEIITQNEELVQQKEEITAQREFIEIKNRELLVVQDELNTLIEKLTTTQNNLASREAENRSILDAVYSTQLLVGEVDLEGRFIKISPETLKILNLSEEEIIGKTFNDIMHKIRLNFDGNPDFETMWQGLIEGQNYSYEIMLQVEDNVFWLKENFFPILNEKGKPIKVMIVAQDITQIKHQKNEIEALNIDLKNNLLKIEKQNELLVQQRREIESINDELKNSNEQIRSINLNLESRVKERTQNLEFQNRQLSEYAYINAHLLRGPLCSILGLVQLLDNDNSGDSDPLIFHLKKSSTELKEVVDKISKAIEKGTHFDRNLLYKN